MGDGGVERVGPGEKGGAERKEGKRDGTGVGKRKRMGWDGIGVEEVGRKRALGKKGGRGYK